MLHTFNAKWALCHQSGKTVHAGNYLLPCLVLGPYRRKFMSDNENIMKIYSLGRHKQVLGENLLMLFLLKVQDLKWSLKQLWWCFSVWVRKMSYWSGQRLRQSFVVDQIPECSNTLMGFLPILPPQRLRCVGVNMRSQYWARGALVSHFLDMIWLLHIWIDNSCVVHK